MANLHDDRATIDWYRTPMPPETLKALNARSDLQGLLQSGGWLLLWSCTASLAIGSAFAGYWYLTPVFIFLHGMVGTFNINAVHELCHNTVFKSKWLNGLFVRVFGFLGWNDWVWFNASHANHHRYTLHPPRDGEVVLPIKWLSRKIFWKSGFWAPLGPYHQYKGAIPRAMGKLQGEWTQTLFPPEKPEALAKLKRWNRSVIAGHALILLACLTAFVLTLLSAGIAAAWPWLIVPLVISHSNTYGGWLFFLCNNTQHVGLTDKVPDFRLCCRSMELPWIVSFLYWHMQYHTEHHMYAAVPCYNLRKLHKQIKHDLPEIKGLRGAWEEIAMILARQETEPDFQYIHPLPPTAHPAVMGDRKHEVEAGSFQADAFADCDDLNPTEDVEADAQVQPA